MPRPIKAVALTENSFKPFGDIIEKESCRDIRAINRGQTARFNNLAALTLDGPGLEPCVSIFQTEAWTVPSIVTELERHPLTSQAFVPLGEASYLVIVAPVGPLNEEAIQVFVASSAQGVNYHPGVWHHRNLSLGVTSDFLVIDADGNTENCDEQSLLQPIEIRL
jgi:ureidoglycolate lyase